MEGSCFSFDHAAKQVDNKDFGTGRKIHAHGIDVSGGAILEESGNVATHQKSREVRTDAGISSAATFRIAVWIEIDNERELWYLFRKSRQPNVDKNSVMPADVRVDDGHQANHASIRLNTSVALVPPKPNEFDSTVPSLALSMRLRTIGMSANTGSSSVMLALSQTKPLFIISSE